MSLLRALDAHEEQQAIQVLEDIVFARDFCLADGGISERHDTSPSCNEERCTVLGEGITGRNRNAQRPLFMYYFVY